MNTICKILFLVLVTAFISNTVISDTLVFDINSDDSEIAQYYDFFVSRVSVDSIKINLKPTILLLCVGLVGVVVFGRQRRANNDNDTSPPDKI